MRWDQAAAAAVEKAARNHCGVGNRLSLSRQGLLDRARGTFADCVLGKGASEPPAGLSTQAEARAGAEGRSVLQVRGSEL